MQYSVHGELPGSVLASEQTQQLYQHSWRQSHVVHYEIAETMNCEALYPMLPRGTGPT